MERWIWVVTRTFQGKTKIEGVFGRKSDAHQRFNELCSDWVISEERFGDELAQSLDEQQSLIPDPKKEHDFWKRVWEERWDADVDDFFEIHQAFLKN